MSSFSEFSKHANHGDLNRTDAKKSKPSVQSTDIAKNRIDPETGNEREGREDDVEREQPTKMRERSQDRNEH
jgi:hypothetical protein